MPSAVCCGIEPLVIIRFCLIPATRPKFRAPGVPSAGRGFVGARLGGPIPPVLRGGRQSASLRARIGRCAHLSRLRASIDGLAFGVDLAILTGLRGGLGLPVPHRRHGSRTPCAFALSYVLNRTLRSASSRDGPDRTMPACSWRRQPTSAGRSRLGGAPMTRSTADRGAIPAVAGAGRCLRSGVHVLRDEVGGLPPLTA